MPTGNLDRLRRGYAALNRGDLSEAVALLAPDILWESETGDAGRGRGSGVEVAGRTTHVWTMSAAGQAVRWRAYLDRERALAAIRG